MKMLRYYLLIAGILIYASIDAQIKDVFVETYYIADENDNANVDGSILVKQSKTYRIFISLEKEWRLTKVFGSENHPLIFKSTKELFNHSDEGVTFGNDLNKNRYKENKIALDSWISLGQISKGGSNVFRGVPKSLDNDGSVIGGNNNDSGILSNQNMEIPLTSKDGIIISPEGLQNFVSKGFFDALGGPNTMFALPNFYEFNSENCFIQANGLPNKDELTENYLVAQITTAGELTFELNIEVTNNDGNKISFVARDTSLKGNEIYSNLLKFPKECGCKDASYLEYGNFSCEDKSKCLNKIIYGCTDSMACNFNPLANFNLESICCYIGYCSDRNIYEICPNLKERYKETDEVSLIIFPNPTADLVNILLDDDYKKVENLSIINLYGKEVMKKEKLEMNNIINLSQLLKGIYFITVDVNGKRIVKKIYKI
jgi:hypothetical protein